jgi:hypothetical protein
VGSDAPPHELIIIGNGSRATEEIALSLITEFIFQERKLLARLHSFRDNRKF